jgi:hypothetical protein
MMALVSESSPRLEVEGVALRRRNLASKWVGDGGWLTVDCLLGRGGEAKPCSGDVGAEKNTSAEEDVSNVFLRFKTDDD